MWLVRPPLKIYWFPVTLLIVKIASSKYIFGGLSQNNKINFLGVINTLLYKFWPWKYRYTHVHMYVQLGLYEDLKKIPHPSCKFCSLKKEKKKKKFLPPQFLFLKTVTENKHIFKGGLTII